MLQVVNDKVSISYQLAAEGGGGIISARDFVNLRYCDVRNGVYICSGTIQPVSFNGVFNLTSFFPHFLNRCFHRLPRHAGPEGLRSRGKRPWLLGDDAHSK